MVQSPAHKPADVSLWRAAQVLLGDSNLAGEFEKLAAVGSHSGGGSGFDFIDALHKARGEFAKRYCLSAVAPVVEALATIANDDGLIAGDLCDSLGEARSLLLQLLERAKRRGPIANQQNGDFSVLVSERTRELLDVSSEALVGLNQMPVLAALCDGVEKTKPLNGVRLFAIQHLFSSSFGLFEAFEKAGVNVEKSRVFGKPYSTNAEVVTALRRRGWNTDAEFQAVGVNVDSTGHMVSLKSPLLDSLRETLEGAAAEQPPGRVLLLDEGGLLNRIVHEAFPKYAGLCSFVEQTTHGLQEMEGTVLLAPAVNVAGSELKRVVEGALMGEDVVAATLETLDRLDPRLIAGKTIGIVGYGAIGQAVAAAFAARGFRVIVTDIDPEAEQRATRDGVELAALGGPGTIAVGRRQDVLGAGVLVGCTGRGCMSFREMGALSDGAILVNAASGNTEFPFTSLAAAKDQGARDITLPAHSTQAFAVTLREADTFIERSPTTVVYNGSRVESLQRWSPSECVEPGKFLFPSASGPVALPILGYRAQLTSDLFFKCGKTRFSLLRGGTPINMDRDIAPKAIQLTRAMLFAGCLQAVRET
ncbi:MAG: hypothetical protein A2341_01510, partial [Deltaproteobacteria bacterium RIFOXYB12_FULL_58_9]